MESVQVSEYRGGHEEIVCPSDPFRVIFNRDRDGMVGWTEEGRKEGGGEERGEENDVSSSWKMKENGSLTCLK